MPTGQKYERLDSGQIWRREERGTGETVEVFAPVYWEDDFLSPSGIIVGDLWTNTGLTGNSDWAQVADENNGVISLALSATSEEQRERLDWNNVEQLCPDNALQIEFRFNMKTVPGADAEIAFGLSTGSATTAAGHTNHASFVLDGAALISCITDDATTMTAAVTSGQTAVSDTWRVCRIDLTDIADVKFYVDGSRVAAGTTFSAKTATNLQPYLQISKASGTNVGTVEFDYVKIWSTR